MVKIVNITDKLTKSITYNGKTIESKYFTKFNNSIQHVKDNIYIMFYRTVWNGRQDEVKDIYTAGHHYAHSIAWFYITSGYGNRERLQFHSSNIAVFLQIDDDNIKVLKSIHLKELDGQHEDLRITDKIQKKNGEIIYIVSCAYSKNLWQKESYNYMGKSFRVGIKMFLVSINTNNLELKFLDDVSSYKNLLCVNESKFIDKNWSIWPNNDKIFITYSFVPYIVMEMKNEPNHCTKIYTDSNKLFQQIEDSYKTKVMNEGTPQMFFRLTTPSIRLNDNEYIGIGHAVFNPYLEELMHNTLSSDKKIYKFIRTVYKEPKFYTHPSFKIYFMFFYTFDPNTFKLLRVSDCYIPYDKSKEHTLIIFPMGITRHHADPNQFIVSYGQGDYMTNLLFISKEEIDNMLYDINSIKESDYDYHILES